MQLLPYSFWRAFGSCSGRELFKIVLLIQCTLQGYLVYYCLSFFRVVPSRDYSVEEAIKYAITESVILFYIKTIIRLYMQTSKTHEYGNTNRWVQLVGWLVLVMDEETITSFLFFLIQLAFVFIILLWMMLIQVTRWTVPSIDLLMQG